MRVLVTGGEGFIGKHLVAELRRSFDCEVTVFDKALSDNQNVRIKDAVRLAACGQDIIFHLAALSRVQPSIEWPIETIKDNVLGTVNVLEAARECNVGRVVFASSSSIYADVSDGGQTENAPTNPLNPYALSKKMGEDLMGLYNKLYGLSTISLRYFNVYGPGQPTSGSYANVIGIFRQQKRDGQNLTVVGDGEQRRDFIYVADVVKANVLAALSNATGAYNIGSGRNYSINEIAALIGGGRSYLPERPGEARWTLADCDKARRELAWAPSFTLEAGLKLLDGYEAR